jgi:hypothetical protein
MFKLLQDYKIRLTDNILKAGVYSKQQLEEAHEDGSFEWCLKYTKLGKILVPFVEEVKEIKINKKHK